jgi:hypothetical protein
MTTFNIYFIGRYKDALGIRERFEERVKAASYDDAVLKLYDKYEHISVLKFEKEDY